MKFKYEATMIDIETFNYCINYDTIINWGIVIKILKILSFFIDDYN